MDRYARNQIELRKRRKSATRREWFEREARDQRVKSMLLFGSACLAIVTGVVVCLLP